METCQRHLLFLASSFLAALSHSLSPFTHMYTQKETTHVRLNVFVSTMYTDRYIAILDVYYQYVRTKQDTLHVYAP